MRFHCIRRCWPRTVDYRGKIDGLRAQATTARLESLPSSGFVGLWVCGLVGLWVCGFVGLWVCGFVGLWACAIIRNLNRRVAIGRVCNRAPEPERAEGRLMPIP